MIHSGLVSVSFRALSPKQVVAMVKQAGLECIEWGGDIHVPHGDLRRAGEVRAMTESEGLRISAYGSYYRVWPREPLPFEAVLETAARLGTPVIRVWAGKIGSALADEDHWSRIVKESVSIAEKAAQEKIAVAYEYHANTLTDSRASALRLMKAVNHPNFLSFWQPPIQNTAAENIDGLVEILPWLRSVHVFAWEPSSQPGVPAQRQPLEAQADPWRQYFTRIKSTGRDHDALLEFVRDDSPEAFLKDAAVLNKLIDNGDRP